MQLTFQINNICCQNFWNFIPPSSVQSRRRQLQGTPRWPNNTAAFECTHPDYSTLPLVKNRKHTFNPPPNHFSFVHLEMTIQFLIGGRVERSRDVHSQTSVTLNRQTERPRVWRPKSSRIKNMRVAQILNYSSHLGLLRLLSVGNE